MRGNPTRWQSAFAIVEVDKRSGAFFHNIIRIVNHRFYKSPMRYFAGLQPLTNPPALSFLFSLWTIGEIVL